MPSNPEKEKAAEAILSILNKFEPEEWDELIGEFSHIQAIQRGKIMEKHFEMSRPILTSYFEIT